MPKIKLCPRWRIHPLTISYFRYDLKTTLLRKHENNISGKSETLVMLIDHANIFG
jgi:hypothetical protein